MPRRQRSSRVFTPKPWNGGEPKSAHLIPRQRMQRYGQGFRCGIRVGELLDFIRQSQTPAEPTGASPFLSHTVVNGKQQKPFSMAWAIGEMVEVEALDEPFFMTADGLVMSHGWDEELTAIAERLASGKSSIRWMSWDKALAAVWQDDRLRLAWLGHADLVSPRLRAVVEANRQSALLRVKFQQK